MEHLKPRQAYEFLQANKGALFVDCRSEIEFFYVGHPVGAEHVPWHEAPDWEINPNFANDIKLLVAGDLAKPIVLICRSGKRTLDAGVSLEKAGFTRVINVLEGFEGPLDDDYHRNTQAGWRFEGLPWEQL
jgi:rhodanese-related sulfurtransferase